jgi:tripeptide aminopeptidase
MAPEQGISAITAAARAIARMRQGRIDEETTANIGVITGGKATNIVAESVVIDGEARSRDPRKLDAQVAHMRECFLEEAGAMGATAKVEIGDVYPAFKLAADSPAVQFASAGLAALGIAPRITATGGGSDANFLNNHGIDAVILSAGYYHPHTTEEYQEEEQLVLLVQRMYEIVKAAG